MKLALVLTCLIALAGSTQADSMPTAMPTSIEMMPEMNFGNDVLLEATPANIQDAVNAYIYSEFGDHSVIAMSLDYQVNFYANGTAFLFMVPSGVPGNSQIDPPVSTPEPNTLILLLSGLVGLLIAYRIKRQREIRLTTDDPCA